RCRSEEHLALLEKECVRLITEIAFDHQLELSYSWTQKFIATQNNAIALQCVKSAAEKHKLHVIEAEHPFSWGEDFGNFTARYPGALFGFGAGNDSPALHQADYDFPDDIIGTGIEVFISVIENALEL
ncbi:MAG: hypothetical protein R6V49_07095, partial [Bacteroidales bacterium]